MGPKKPSMQKNHRLAYHEAGHAVLAARFEIGIERVAIKRLPGKLTCSIYQSAMDYCPLASAGFLIRSSNSAWKNIWISCMRALRRTCWPWSNTTAIPREVVDAWQDHAGDRRPTASDLYYHLGDKESQEFMQKVPFGDGKPAADAGN